MDVAKYIGLYLLKNHYCTIPSLGQLRILKDATVLENNQLIPQPYRVELTSVGAIDDGFPIFIANAEQVSISKSSNAVSTFVKDTKEAIANGEEVIVPAIGKFVSNNGQLHFITNMEIQYTAPAIPVNVATNLPRTSAEQTTTLTDAPTSYADGTSMGRFNWGKAAMFLIILGVLGFAGYYAFKEFSKKNGTAQKENNTAIAETPATQKKTNTAPAIINQADSTQVKPTNTNDRKLILNTYSNLASAEKRAAKLKSYGNDVAVLTKDSSTHFVVMNGVNVQDTTRLLDSLRNLFNPKEGVRFYP